MKIFFDSSVLIAACVQNHPKHPAAFEFLKQAKNKQIEAFISAHSLLETYSVLTRAPFKPKISPEDAHSLITRNIISNIGLATLEATKYSELIDILSHCGFVGGIVHDALIVFCAHEAGADKIVTANSADFLRITSAFSFELEVVGI